MKNHTHLTFEEIEKVFKCEDDFSDEATAFYERVQRQINSCDVCFRRLNKISLNVHLFGNEYFDSKPKKITETVKEAVEDFTGFLRQNGKVLTEIMDFARDGINLIPFTPSSLLGFAGAGLSVRGAGVHVLGAVAGVRAKDEGKKKNIILCDTDKNIFELTENTAIRVAMPLEEAFGKKYELNVWDIEKGCLSGEPAVFKITPLAPERMSAETNILEVGKYLAAVVEVDTDGL